ncbi:hypothetical protein BKA65DRAFT_487769 [Rhexocercosporidium sp. MPI-PUGE-AT-0058]|nr:hypothetical protein BKA65DRAFT_487769 [Rhexocercosporidium sp. MPI-PUGE-AT-0058]
MAEKTIASIYQMNEAARRERPRQLLQYEKDRAQIYFDHTEDEEEEEEEDERPHKSGHPCPTTHESHVTTTPTISTSTTVVMSNTSTQRQNTAAIPDIPLNSGDIVTTIIAHILRKRFGEVSKDKTIKQLAGGWWS